MEIKKPLNSVEVSDELDKSENDKKLKEKSTDSKTFESKTETTVSLKKVNPDEKIFFNQCFMKLFTIYVSIGQGRSQRE